MNCCLCVWKGVLYRYLVGGEVLWWICPNHKIWHQTTANRCMPCQGTPTCPVVFPLEFILLSVYCMYAMLKSVYIHLIANSCNFLPCHSSPLQVPKHNPGWDSLCLADTFRTWQLKLLTMAFQSLSVLHQFCVCVCVPSDWEAQHQEGGWRQ